MIKIVLLGLVFLISCSGPGLQVSQEDKVSKVKPKIIWEPSSRKIYSGSDAQLVIRASESMNLLYAAHNKEGQQNLFMSRTRNIGDSFSKSIRVNTSAGEVRAHGENGPKLRAGKRRGLFAAWIGNRDIKFARSMNFGKSFSPAIRVNDDTGKASQSFFAMETAPDGKVLIAWLDGRDKRTNTPGTSSVYFARSIDQGASFEKNIKISGDVCPCCRPSLAFGDNGEIFASWRHVYKNSERFIVVASSLDGGITWSDPVKVTDTGWVLNGCAHSGPSMKFLKGKLFISWYTGANNKANLKLAYSSDYGKTFHDTGKINGPILDANHPDISVIGEEAWIIFQGRDPKRENGWSPETAWLVRVEQNGEFSEPTPLPSVGESVAYPYIFSGSGGRVYATWTEVGEDGPKVVLCRGRIQ